MTRNGLIHWLSGALASVLLTLSSASADAATYDPDLKWRTIQTEHFNIHFHQGEEQLADEFSVELEEIYTTMVDELKWTPRRRTELVLIDRTDTANGYAQVVPYNTIVIYVTAPQEDSTLSFYEDWTEAIATHELTHILHMDTNHGIVRVARAVVGRIASTNDLSPWWMVEGLATFQETRHTPGGRGRSLTADMIKRTAVVEDAFPPMGNLDGLQPDPPGGNLRYLFGQDFIQYVAEHTGEDVWTRWVHTYGSHVPYILPSKKVFGKLLVPLYFDWKEQLFDRYGTQATAIEAAGIRQGRLVSDGVASCGAPRFSPDDDKLVWSCYDRATGSAIWMADGSGYVPEKILQDRGAKNFTWRRDSKAFVFAATHVVNRFNTWSDIYMHELGGDSVRPLTSGKRARDPDFSPDGSRLMVVTNKVSDNQLEVMTVDRILEPLTEISDHTQFSTPRYAPNGNVIALSLWKDGRRDLWLYSPEGEPLRRLTADIYIDRDPEWSGDGRYLYFASDRSGVPNIYAIEIATERLFQVTNVLTGATKPSVRPDGTFLAYQQYSQDGWDVRVMDLDPADWIDRGQLARPPTSDASLTELIGEMPDTTEVAAHWTLPEPELAPPAHGVPFDPFPQPAARPQDAETLDTFDQAEVENVFGEEKDYPFRIEPRRYNPLPTLLPRFVAPFVQLTPFAPAAPFDFVPFAVRGTVITSTSDALRRYGWTGSLDYRTDANYLGWTGSFTVNRFLPIYSFGASSRAASPSPILFTDPADPFNPDGSLKLLTTDPQTRYWERRLTAYAQVSYPYTFRTWIFAQYNISQRRELDPLPDNAYLPLIPLRGYIGSISGGWRYSWNQQTAYSISTEDGRIFSLVGSLRAPWLGTFVRDDRGELQPLTQAQVTAEVREYIVNPFVPNHVLAMRAAGGVTVGGTDFLGNYQLGGNLGDGAFYSTPDEFRMLRGYAFGADVGDLYWLTGAEYRFPISRIQRGVGTIPVFLRNLSGLVFLDAGNAFLQTDPLSEAINGTLVGAGAELRLSTALGWGTFLTGRLGYGVGLTNKALPVGSPTRGLDWNDPRTVYFQIGGSF